MEIDKLRDKAFDWLVNFGPRVLVAIIVFIIGQWLINLLKSKVALTTRKKNFSPSLRPFIHGLIFTVLQILLLLLIMQIAGIQLTIFAALIAAFGAAAGLALSGTLQNFAGGVLILLLKPFRVGDNIKAQGEEGTVLRIQLFNTHIRMYDNRLMIVPNSKLSNEVIINISREGSRRLDIELEFSYSYDPEKIKNIVDRTIAATKEIQPVPKARTGIIELGGSTYTFVIQIWVSAHGYLDTKLLINELLLEALRKDGIKLPGMDK